MTLIQRSFGHRPGVLRAGGERRGTLRDECVPDVGQLQYPQQFAVQPGDHVGRLTGGEVADVTQAPALIDGFDAQTVVADKGYAPMHSSHLLTQMALPQ